MTEATARSSTLMSRKQRNDQAVRRLTAAAGAAAFGLAGLFVGLAVGAPNRGAATPISPPPPNADQALAKAVIDYEAAAAKQSAAPVAPPRQQLAAAPARPAARPPAVAVSGGS